jgi:hypothetical protein
MQVVPLRYATSLRQLELARPESITQDRHECFCREARTFFQRWGRQAERLGWSCDDLLGIETGLLWSLRGQTVTDLGAKTAKLSGGLVFRKRS